VSDPGHLAALADVESAYGVGARRGSAGGFRWWQIVAAFVLLGLLAYGGYRLVWPASYQGTVRFDSGYTTLTLVDSGVVLDVSEDTEVSSTSGDDASIALRRTKLFGPRTAPFRATVIWRPYRWGHEPGAARGFAQSIETR
jgi:hypothetical protein